MDKRLNCFFRQQVLLYELAAQQVFCTGLHAFKLLAAAGVFNLNKEGFVAVGIEILENLLEVHHARLSQDKAVLDV